MFRYEEPGGMAMTLDQQNTAFDALEQDADTIANFVASLDNLRLEMMESAIAEELMLRYQGKPLDKAKLH
jgi:hypothetical protein